MATVSERLDAIAASGMEVAFDGCHKIYLCESHADGDDARACGYDVYPASRVREFWEASCGLEFVHPWNLGKSELNIDQFEEQDELSDDDWLGDLDEDEDEDSLV